jgi:hypothetical protein
VLRLLFAKMNNVVTADVEAEPPAMGRSSIESAPGGVDDGGLFPGDDEAVQALILGDGVRSRPPMA